MGIGNKGPQKVMESLVRAIGRIRTGIEHKRTASEQKVAGIPETVAYRDSPLHDVWNKFPLGVHANNEEAVWDANSSSNALIVGDGRSESLTQRNIVFHCILNKDKWDFLGIDLWRVELTPYTRHSSNVKVVTSVEDGVAELRSARDEMMKRYELMVGLDVNNFQDLPQPPKALMIMIDEAYSFLALTGNKSDEGREEDRLRGEALNLLTDIAYIGGAAGIRLVLVTERFSVDVFNDDLVENCMTRIATCRTNSETSRRLFANEEAAQLDSSIKGRGYVQNWRRGAEFQAYWSDQDFLPVIQD